MITGDRVITKAIKWLRQGKLVALATVVSTWGSSPRPVGSQLAVNSGAAFEGSVSGGCIEGAVVKEALEVIEGGPPRSLVFGVTDKQAWEVGLACGGSLQIHLCLAPAAEQLEHLLQQRPVAQVTRLQDAQHCLVYPETVEGSLQLDRETLESVRESLRQNVNRMLSTTEGDIFVHVFNPPLRLIVVGAVHIAQTLTPLAKAVGYEVIIVDPRRAFATGERLPDTTLLKDWPDEALDLLAPDSRTAVVTLTHDPKLDDPALARALASDAFYIGSLGSSRTHAKRVERLTAMGFSADDLARIKGPVGLDIGAKSSAEIALSIIAEIVAANHGKLVL